MVIIHTNFGAIELELDTVNTPKTTANFLEYAKSGFYDGTIFHRVIDGFMIQGGGFKPGMIKKDTLPPIENEAAKGLNNNKGTIAMARTMDPHSATCQFFINVADNAFLNFKSKTLDGWGYCAFGKVVSGMEIVNKIKKLKTTSRAGHQDVPVEDAIIERVEIIENTH